MNIQHVITKRIVQLFLLVSFVMLLQYDALAYDQISGPLSEEWKTIGDNTAIITLYIRGDGGWKCAGLIEFKGLIDFDTFGFMNGADTIKRLYAKLNVVDDQPQLEPVGDLLAGMSFSATAKLTGWRNVKAAELVRGRIIVTTDDGLEWTIQDPAGSFTAVIAPGRVLEGAFGLISAPVDNTALISLYKLTDPDNNDWTLAAYVEISGQIEFDRKGVTKCDGNLLRFQSADESATASDDKWRKIVACDIAEGRIIITTDDNQTWTIYDLMPGNSASILPGRVMPPVEEDS